MGKELETAVVRKAGTQGGAVAVLMCTVVCPHTAAAAVGEGKMGPAKQPWLNWKPSGPCPRHLIAWF